MSMSMSMLIMFIYALLSDIASSEHYSDDFGLKNVPRLNKYISNIYDKQFELPLLNNIVSTVNIT